MDSITYSELSKKLTKQICKQEKKNNGIYFTPPKTIYKILNNIKPFMKNIKYVLEPSCGSCEIILMLNKMYNNINITGIEFNKTIFNSIQSLENDNIKLYNEDFISYKSENNYDLIIGNPPYFVMKKQDVDKSYYNYFEGRPNIFILFIIKSLQLLNSDGILAFVLPKSFLNCLYYDKTRKYIYNNYQILDIFECDDEYIETKQETVTIIIQNKKPNMVINNNYCLKIEKYTIFGSKKNINELNSLYNNSSTLKKLNFKVSVGNVVWNQCKKILTDDNSKTLLIYSSDIKNNTLQIQKYSNVYKKNYIEKKGEKGPILVLNRGYGVGKYNFVYCLINEEFDYLIENHLICIRYNKSIKKEDLIKLYEKIMNSFKNDKTKKFIELYFGNNAINTTELNEILPIYDI